MKPKTEKKPKAESKHHYNEMKYKILKTLFFSHKYFTPEEIANTVGVSVHAVRQRLTNLNKWGYIWRRQEFRKNGNDYCYRYLKPKGFITFIELDKRVKLREETGIFIPLNLKKPIPEEAMATEAFRRIFGGSG